MGFLVSNGKNGVMSYSGTEYVNPTHGTRRLCIRTGSGSNGVVKYGLTSDSSASSYCGMKMRVDGNTAYIGKYKNAERIETFSSSSFSSKRSTSTYSVTQRTGTSSTQSRSGPVGYFANFSSTYISDYDGVSNATYSKHSSGRSQLMYSSYTYASRVNNTYYKLTRYHTTSSNYSMSSFYTVFIPEEGGDNFNL